MSDAVSCLRKRVKTYLEEVEGLREEGDLEALLEDAEEVRVRACIDRETARDVDAATDAGGRVVAASRS